MSRIEEAILKVKARAVSSAPVPPPPRVDASADAVAAPVRPVSTTESDAPAQPPPTAAPARSIRVDPALLREHGLLPPPAEERRIASEYRGVKRTLLANLNGRAGEPLPKANLMMVASALPGEGKTFTSVNLALSLALEKDYAVTLVDADVVKPNISRALGLADEIGLIDLLGDGSLTIRDVEIGTSVPGLTVIPAGRPRDTSAELISSARAAKIFASWERDPRRIFVLDSTPLLLTNESRLLAEFAGQVVLVVRADVTPKSAVQAALDQLPGGRFVGLVLNQYSRAADEYYGYGAAYGYGAR